jgi:septation ring formation regulator EzrA
MMEDLDNTPIMKSIDSLERELNKIRAGLNELCSGNKGAAQRVRVCLLNLEKLGLHFRKVSANKKELSEMTQRIRKSDVKLIQQNNYV